MSYRNKYGDYNRDNGPFNVNNRNDDPVKCIGYMTASGKINKKCPCVECSQARMAGNDERKTYQIESKGFLASKKKSLGS